MLTRKHFEVIARILGENNASEKMIDDFIKYFKTENPYFDVIRFRDAVERAKLKKVERVI